MRVLVGCEFSATVREAFRRRGHDAWSCDLKASEVYGQHIIGDVRDVLRDGWDLFIVHPDCTFVCNSGVRWLYERPGRWAKMEKAAKFMRWLLNDS